MKKESLNRFFTGDITASHLTSEISNEVQEYSIALKKKGSSSPVYLSGDGLTIITSQNVLKLLDAFHTNALKEIELNYIVDALVLSDELLIESEAVEDVLHSLTDPDVNGPITARRVLEIQKLLKS